ncbi:MAG: sugar phosphate nucleotidyltransferase [Candidatus Altiarchaeota archaeon]
MKAVVLAGGFGTRMRPLTLSRPKPLLPLLNVPVTEHILDHLHLHGVTEVAITTNYLREHIVDCFGGEYKGMKLTYPAEEKPLGTAGCVKNIKGYFDDTFIVMQGDLITDVDLTDLIRQHKYHAGLATIAALRVPDPWNYGVIDVADDGRVRRFHEKPLMNECTTDLANTGIYVLEPQALEHIPSGTFYDFAKDLFPILLERQSLFAQMVDAFWVDVGRPEGYNAAKKWLLNRLAAEIPDCTIIDGKIEGAVAFGKNVQLGVHSQIFGPVLIGDGVTIDKGCVIGPYTVLGSGVTVREYSVINGAVLFENIEVGSGEDVSSSLIAEGCRIGSGGTIQSDVMIGGNCLLENNVSVINGSRIWPNIGISVNSLVSGTLKRFIQLHEVRDDPRFSLRTVSPDEGFYFNKLEGNRVSFTGLRALSLLEFANVLKHVELSSLDYHLRSDVNDFQPWLNQVVSDTQLSSLFQDLKRECAHMDRKVIRHRMVEATNDWINHLLNAVRPTGYL